MCQLITSNVFRVCAGLVVALASHFACADAETGYFNINTYGSDSSNGIIANAFSIANVTPPAGGTGRCGYGLVFAALNSDGNKTMYSTLLAANLAGKQIGINYTISGTSCNLTSVTINR